MWMPHLYKFKTSVTYLLGCVEVLLGVVLVLELLLHGLLLLLVNLLLQLYNTSLDPRVLESLLRSHSLLDLPLEALVHEVDEHVVLALHHFGKALGVRVPYLALGVRVLKRSVVIVEEDLSPA